MAGLIKKQILKHLSKFAKNLSADSINLSTLKGEGEMNNLELDCLAIQNLLDLPTWLQINHAKCNRVHVKFLDCVEMDMTTCEKPRPPNGPSPIEASASSGDSSYGFIEKVLEGITVRINSINVNFTSAVFTAEFQISQLLVHSTDPDGKKADLRSTRIINNHLGQILTFKKITWQTMRVVIDAASVRTGGVSTPIRLITNQVTIEIVLRRKLSDLVVLASKLHLKFDDLLWVLSDLQVQSALLCVKSIRETIERSRLQGRTRSATLTKQSVSPPNTPHPADAPTDSTASDPYFLRHMIHETSYHCDVDRVDLHICDDGSSPNTEASYKKVVEGGAILITLNGFKMDHYPYHKAGKSRSYFRGYNEVSLARDKWAEEIIVQFRRDFVALKKAAAAKAQGREDGPKGSSKLLESCLVFRLNDIEIGQVSSVSDKERSNRKVLTSQREKLHLPDDMPLGTVILTDYFYPDGRDYPAPHNNMFVRVNAPQLYVHWPSLLWMNQLSLTTIRSVQEMLEDLGVVMGMTDVREEVHTDIRIETLMPKIHVPLLHSNSDENSPDEIEIHVSQATVTNCRHGKNAARKSLAEALEKIKNSFLFNNSSFPHDKGHDYDLIHQVLEQHASEGDSPLKEALEQGEMKRSSLLGKAFKDVWTVWVRQAWLDFAMKETNPAHESRPKTLPLLDSVPLTLWLCKTEVSIPQFTPVPIPPVKTESLPSTPTVNCDLRKTQSEHVIVPDQDEVGEFPDEQKQERFKRNKKLLDFYRQSIEKEEEAARRTSKPIDGAAAKYILINSDEPINLMLDHYQFVFVMRLMETIGHVGEKVLSDTTTILSSHRSSATSVADDTDSSGVRIFLPLINIFLLLRPSTAVQPSGTDSANPIAPNLMNIFEQTRKRMTDPAIQLRLKTENRLRMLAQIPPSDNMAGGLLHFDNGHRNMDSLSNATSTSFDDDSRDSSGTSSLDQFVVLEMDPATTNEDTIVTSKSPKRPPLLPQDLPVLNLCMPELAWLQNSELKPHSMTDSTVTVVNPVEAPNDRAGARRSPQQVSLLQITADDAVELTVDSRDNEVSIRIIAHQVAVKELGDMSLDAAVSKFVHSGSTSSATPSAPPHIPPCLRMRIDSGHCAKRFYPRSDAHMQIEVRHFNETLLSSTLANLGVFLEDDKVPDVLPMKIDAYDVTLSIENDVMPVYPTSAPLPPIQLSVHEAHVRRDAAGTFHISTETEVAPDLLKSLHFSQQAPPTLPANHNPAEVEATTVANDNLLVQDVTSLKVKLEEMTRERDSLALALEQLKVKLESEIDRTPVTSLLD